MNQAFLSISSFLLVSCLARQTFAEILPSKDTNVYRIQFNSSSLSSIQTVSIPANKEVLVNVTNVSSDVSFMIFQVHTYQYNVTLSTDKDSLNKVSNRSVFGSNIGLYYDQMTNTRVTFYVKNDNAHNVTALFVAMLYNDKVPIPGGCNMEFNTEIAPYVHVYMQNSMVVADVPPPSQPLNNNDSRHNCDKNQVEIEMYRIFLAEQDFHEDSYFTAIESMLTLPSIMETATKIKRSSVSSPTREVFSAYTGVGSVYVAVATYEGHSVPYVPGFSYACNPIVDPDSCKVLVNSISKFVCASCFFLALLSMCINSKCKIDIGLPIFFNATLMGYAMTDNIGYAILIGIAITVLSIPVQLFCPLFRNMLYALTLGLFLEYVLYFHITDTYVLLKNDFAFWIFFILMLIFVTLSLGFIPLMTSNLASIVYESFMMILPLDYWFGSCLKYIVINMLRRMTVKGFAMAVVGGPTQTTDIVLIVLWTFLATLRSLQCPLSITNYAPL